MPMFETPDERRDRLAGGGAGPATDPAQAERDRLEGSYAERAAGATTGTRDMATAQPERGPMWDWGRAGQGFLRAGPVGLLAGLNTNPDPGAYARSLGRPGPPAPPEGGRTGGIDRDTTGIATAAPTPTTPAGGTPAASGAPTPPAQ